MYVAESTSTQMQYRQASAKCARTQRRRRRPRLIKWRRCRRAGGGANEHQCRRACARSHGARMLAGASNAKRRRRRRRRQQADARACPFVARFGARATASAFDRRRAAMRCFALCVNKTRAACCCASRFSHCCSLLAVASPHDLISNKLDIGQRRQRRER